MKTVLSVLLSFLPYLVVAQSSHWRYTLSVGRTKPFTSLTTARPIADDRLTVYSRANMSVQAALERSIRNNLSLRASIGHQQVGYGFSSTNSFRDTTGRVLGRSISSSRSTGNGLTVGTLGLTVNSRTYGRTILTAGLDGVIRVNGRASLTGRRSGGRSTSSTTIQGIPQRYETIYEFESQPMSPVTFGVAGRVGLDYRISKRGLISTQISYTQGFGSVLDAVSTDLRIDGVPNEGRYSSRGSNVTVQLGYKRNLFRVNPLDPLQFTPYNKPDLASRRTLTPEQRQQTFRAKSWLYELRSNYGPLTGRSIRGARVNTDLASWGVGGNVGYFFANRHSIGLAVDYQQYGDGPFSRLFGNFLQAGPVLRTYAGRGRVAPYLEGGYQMGWFVGPLTPSRFVSTVPVTAGFSVRVNESVRLNGSYAMRYFWQQGRQGTTPGLPQLSLSYSPKAR